MLEPAIHDGVRRVAAAEWDRCLPGFLERHDCLAAIEDAGIEGFDFHALTVWRDGALVACAPAFVTRYDLVTMLDPGAQAMAARVGRMLPRLVRPRLACLGSPCTEVAPIGFAPGLKPEEQAEAASALVAGLERLAARSHADLVALKDVTAADAATLADAMARRRYADAQGFPVAALAIDFASIDDYLARLSPGTRRDMRRKLRAAARLRIERTRRADGVLDRVMALYAQTRARAAMAFETLTPAYFRNMLACEGAFLTLYWDGDELVAANLVVETQDTLLDKFFCMDAASGRPLNIYFLSWFENLRHCLEHGLARYQAGQAAYANKLRLGCTLQPTRMYFRHRNPLLHPLLALAARWLVAMPAAADAG